MGSSALEFALDHPLFNSLLLTASLGHMGIIAMNSCHEPGKGETSWFCGKVWDQCIIENNGTVGILGNDANCTLRKCLEPGCEEVSTAFSDRPLYALLLYLANFWMRWVYTGITALRMMAKGVILKDDSFFQSAWCIMDLSIVVLAWLNTPYVFGNFMFFMVARGAKLIVASQSPWLATPRVQFAAVGLGLYKILVVFLLINFILAFVSLLGVSLLGSKGDFHNRCAVPVIHDDGGNISFVYEPLVPERPCRMNQLYDLNTINCFSDVWTTEKTNFTPSSQTKSGLSQPGCQGTCGSVAYYKSAYLQTELNLGVEGVDNNDNPVMGDAVYCIGPDFAPLDKTQFPPSTPGVKGGSMKDYKNANLTNWPSFGNNDPRNFDDIGHAAIVLYTIFYRNGWTGPVGPAMAIAGTPVVLGWIIVMVFVSYYLLNITVSITCAHYSEATEKEIVDAAARAAALLPPVFDDDDDGEEGDEEEEEDDEEPAGPKSTRDKLLEDLRTGEDYPWCGRGCDICTLIGKALTFLRNLIAGIVKAKQPPIYKIGSLLCNPIQNGLGLCFKTCCHKFIACSISLVFPGFETKAKKGDESDDEDEEDDAPPQLQKSIMSRVSVICMLGCMLTQGLQSSQIPLYKCACSDTQIRQLENFDSLIDCDSIGLCSAEFDNPNGTIFNSNQTCVYGKCLTKSFQGYACYNPRFNRVVHAGNFTGGLPQPAAEEWMTNRANWCNFGMLLHFALYGWAFIFLLELCSRFLAHQGVLNFFTNALDPDPPTKKNKNPMLKPNFRNIVDTVCILATVAGIFFTEFTFNQFSLATFMDTQLLLAGVSFNMPLGDDTGFPWIFKLLRLATIIRIAIRTSSIAKIPAVAVILRGFKGPEKVLLGIVLLLLVVFFSSLTGKELFDYGYSSMNQRFEMLSNFQDISSSMLPLMQVMCGSGWYEYAKAGTKSIGIMGFIFFCIYYFIVFFQFQRIFIAIIVQNFELNDEEKEQAQQLILEMKFKEVEFSVEDREDFFGEKNVGGGYDKFSFTTHYMKLLRGAKLSLRELIEYSEHLASGGRGFSTANENALAGELPFFLDEDNKDEDDGDEMEKIRKQMAKIKSRLTINPIERKKKKAGGGDEVVESIMAKVSKQCKKLVDENQYWLGLLLFVIFASVVCAVWSDIDETFGMKGLGDMLSLGFLGFFFAEMALKMIGYGLYSSSRHSNGYFNRAWCCVDFGLVLAQAFDVFTSLFPQIISLGESSNLLTGFRAIRALRVLVALKKIRKETNPLYMIMAALGASMPAIFTLLCAVIFVMFIYALVGMDQYAGLLSRCVTEDELDSTGTKCRVDSHCSPGYVGQCPFAGIGTFSYCTMDKRHCFGNKELIPSAYENTHWRSLETRDFRFLAPRQWVPTSLNFDNIYSSIFSVFSLINKSKLDPMLVQLLSVSGRDMAPVQNSSPMNSIYLFSLLLLVGIFVSQIVIGMIMTNLRLKSGLAFHSREQLVWPATKDALALLMTSYSPFLAVAGGDDEEPEHPLFKVLHKIKSKCRGIRDNWKFNVLMSVTVIFNCVLLGSYYYDLDGPRQELYFWGGFACFILYCFEFLIHGIADLLPYLSVGRNQFDVFLTALTALDIFVLPATGLDLGLASLRMFRLMKLLYKSNTFERLMDTIMASLPEAVATIALNVVVIFVFGALATNMFRGVKEGEVIDDVVNFNNFMTSLITIFRMSSGAAWGDVITDSSVGAPGCTPLLWRPVDLNATDGAKTLVAKERERNFMSLGEWNQWDLKGHIEIPTDCGTAMAAYPVFLIFIFLNNYLLLPTFIASIIASYFKANLRDLSLISDKDLKKYQEAWGDLGPENNALTKSSKMTFKKSDKAPKNQQGYDFAKFNSLIEMLAMKGCVLGFSPMMEPTKYKMVMQRLKLRAEDKKSFSIDYITMCVILLSIAEKARPVTIVDILRREKAVSMMKIEAQRKAPPKPKPKGDKQHASINMPPEHLQDKKLNSLTAGDLTYSYNLYVVLDQLARINPEAKHGETEIRLSKDDLNGLKKMVDENDEDLLVYFEEYVEKSGPVYIDNGQAYKAFCRFGKVAKDMYTLSKHFKKADGKKGGKKEEGQEEEDEDEEAEDADADADADAEGTGPGGEEDDDEGGGGGNRISIGFGEAIETDEGGILDLRNWSECCLCGEPVDNSWERCPTCGKKNPSGTKS